MSSPIAVGLSTASVYPLGVSAAFEAAARLGYDGVEVMVWNDPLTQDADVLNALARAHDLPIMAVHAPTLLVTQRVFGPEPWAKIDGSIAVATRLGVSTVVVHPPFRWQREYAEEFTDGVAIREQDEGVCIAVENMFPWRARSRELLAYAPHWDPVEQPYDHVTLDLSHTATAGSDAMAMADALGPRLHHLHLADGLGSSRDEHLVPGRGSQPCGPMLERLATTGYQGSVIVEVSTRRASEDQRENDLLEALAFARLHLDAPHTPSGEAS